MDQGFRAALVAIALLAAPAAAITGNQLDDFQDGTTQGWGGGSGPTNVADGGPDGAGDRYLQISATGSQLGTRNVSQWTGDYLVEGVVELIFDLNNFGPSPVALRISVEGPGGIFTSTDETPLLPGSGWVSAGFELSDAALTQVTGFGTLEETLEDVTKVLIRHDPTPLSPPGSSDGVSATLGIDNVFPEPGHALGLAAALAALLATPRARRRP